MTDLYSHILRAYGECRALTEKEKLFLTGQGIHPDALDYGENNKYFRILATLVRWEGCFFDFDRNGTRAAIIVCRDEAGEVADMVAWAPSEGHLARWAGNVSMLGEELIRRPRLSGDRLWVYPTPLEWLQHRRAGVVVLDYDKARAPLAAASPISVHTEELRKKMQAAWRHPRIEVSAFDMAATILASV